MQKKSNYMKILTREVRKVSHRRGPNRMVWILLLVGISIVSTCVAKSEKQTAQKPTQKQSQVSEQSEFRGKVVGVIDGDTIKVMNEGRAIKIRLYGIDAPERKKPFGTQSKKFLSDLVFKKQVMV